MEDKLKIVFLDAHTTNPGDLAWDAIATLGDFIQYSHTSDDQFLDRARQADVIISNKFILNRERLQKLPKLKLICVAATGMNNVDLEAANSNGIVVKNVQNYSTDSVCQQVFAMLFAFLNRVESHDISVKNGDWNKSRDFSYTLLPIENVVGKTFGVVGFGNIGRAVAKVAQAFGMKVIAVNKYPERSSYPNIENHSLDDVISNSDIISLHVPLNELTLEMINVNTLAKMKQNAILINTGRGALINEQDLFDALSKNKIKGACLDVLTNEPPKELNPLYRLENCIITPHVAWAGVHSRQNLIDGIANNIRVWSKKK